MATQPSKNLEVKPNPHPNKKYNVHIETDEFTALCPMTGQPDFATLTINYIPDEYIVELKSLKLYLWSYRNEGIFHEDVTNRIADDLIKVLSPHYIKVIGNFNIRGGIRTIVTVERTKGTDF